MAYYATCDVKGCDEVAPVDHPHSRPRGWFVIVFEVLDPEERERTITQFHPSLGTRVELLDPVSVLRNVIMCPAHDMPEFDPEPVRPVPELAGVVS